MKTKNLSSIILTFVGILILFLFPNPEENFLAYFATALFFIILITFLLIKSKKK
jgi:hypothetical protein